MCPITLQVGWGVVWTLHGEGGICNRPEGIGKASEDKM